MVFAAGGVRSDRQLGSMHWHKLLSSDAGLWGQALGGKGMEH